MRISPRGKARFVAARPPGNPAWREHVAVRVAGHFVDALTGANGVTVSQYLATFFAHPDALTTANQSDEELEGMCR